MGIDITQELRNAENALRDFIAYMLHRKFGENWETQIGISEDRLGRWEERKETEAKRQGAGAVDERLIYYADFFDLRTILKKQWDILAPAFGDLRTTEVWLGELEKLRDPDAHRRELLPHQKDLVAGISGELRTKIARFRSSQETSDAYYPRIEFAADNLGNTWKVGNAWSIVYTGKRLRPGDMLEFVVTAVDPLGEDLEYQCTSSADSVFVDDCTWAPTNTFRIKVTENHVGKNAIWELSVKSKRLYHAHKSCDDYIEFAYEVLPPLDL